MQYFEYGGNLYGLERAEIDAALVSSNGIQAFIESGVRDLRAARYEVVSIRIIPTGAVRVADERRRREDEARSKEEIDFAYTLENSFSPGGLEKARTVLLEYIERAHR